MSAKLPKGAVVFENVSKRYRLGTLGTLRGAVSAALSRRRGEPGDRRTLWALRDVSFRLQPGEALGLIGPNGAGKTTALRLMSNITQPTSGRVAVGGRFSSLIELGAGFHPELTGRENVFLNGAILGLGRREIEQRLDSIVAFSELERFIDTPVKRYSSGMYVRLGFAVAAHVEPDVLLVDEVLAVGDSAFRQRCIERMDALREVGTTIVFVSHNMHQVRRLCQRALLLMQGEPRFLGEASEAISTYEAEVQSSRQETPELGLRTTMGVRGAVVVTGVSLLDDSQRVITRLRYDQILTVRASYRTSEPLRNPIVKMRVLRNDGTVCAMVGSHHGVRIAWTLEGQGTITARFEPIQLMAGHYSVEVRIIDSGDTILLASDESPQFYVDSPGLVHEVDRGFFVPRVSWTHDSGEGRPG